MLVLLVAFSSIGPHCDRRRAVAGRSSRSPPTASRPSPPSAASRPTSSGWTSGCRTSTGWRRAGASGFLLKDASLDRLTACERDVLKLLARGRPNSEIAHELVVSQATTKTHVRDVLAKLDLHDRVHAVVFAYEAGLVQPGDSGSVTAG